MTLLRRLARRLGRLFGSRHSEADMAEEMRFHLEQRAADYAADGLADEEARYAAQRRFGNVGSLQEQAREVRGWGWLERFFKDLRFAFRQLIRSPGFTVLAVATLALGVGVNTAMFNVLDSTMFRPLPYADAGRLERIFRVTPQNPEGGVAAADFSDLQREAAGYGEVIAYASGAVSVSEPGQPAEMAPGLRITANFFSVLGIQPQLGRDFRTTEDRPGNDRILIISQRVWQNRFGGRPDVIGRIVRVDGVPHEIVGVLPAAFNDWRHLGWVDLFRPLGLDRAQSTDRQAATLQLIGRRSAQLSRAEAGRFISGFGARLAADFAAANAGSTWRTVPLTDTTAGGDGAPAMYAMLIGLSGFVLLIACSNLANLLLARTMARAREFAVRSALGASRTQLLRPLIAEALLLALAGGACAVLVAVWAGDWLSLRSTGDNGERVLIALNGRGLGWALAASLLTAFAFGLAPALFALRLDLNSALKSGGRGTTGGRGHQRFRQVLIVGQFALALVLLAGAALFIRGLDDLNHRRSGWASDHLVTATVLLPAATYPNAEKITAFHRLVLARLQALPGVASASIAASAPFFNWSDARKYVVEGRDLPEYGHEPAAAVNSISPRYFETFETRLLAGRDFRERDNLGAPRVYVINQAMARGLFGDENPVGRRIAQAGGATLQWGEIVGVVADVKSASADSAPVAYQLYQPMAQEPRLQHELAVRTAGVAPSSLLDGIRSVMTQLDPDLPVRRLLPADARIERANYQLAVLRDMLSAFALLGLGLATLGVYGIIARTMAQRTGEFAIRLALGASVRNIVRMVLASGVKLALTGSALGLFGALGVFQLLASGFPSMRFDGAWVLLAATAFLVLVALLACYLPARNASRINPMEALRLD